MKKEKDIMKNDMTKKTAETTAKAPEAELLEMRPAVDIIEAEEGVTLFFEVPGANAKTVDVEVNDGVLYVSAKSSLKRAGKQIVYKRAFQISDAVDVEKISAKTVDGVLKLVLPKSERAKVHKVKVGC